MVKNFIPEGVEDLNFEQYEKIAAVEDHILEVFRNAGYRQIRTPSFEYLDLFLDEGIPIDTEDMYKIVDSNGKLMVLKPDATVPIARMVATHYSDLKEDLKFMYNTNVYRNMDFRAGGKREFRQAGIEYFGSNSPDTDAGIIRTAVEAVRSAGADDLIVELGDSGYFNGLMDALRIEGITEEDRIDEIREMVESKQIPALTAFCDAADISDEAASALKALPFLYGDVENVSVKALEYALNDKMKAAVENIGLVKRALGDTVLVTADLGLVNKLDYYSGMIFRLYLRNTGTLAGSGGRYDGLMEQFGKNIPAAGFGLNIGEICDAVQSGNSGAEVINIALGKGRLADLTIEKLNEAGIEFPDYDKKSRKLIFEDSTGTYRIIFVKAVDVGIYVEKGACDVGVIGKDTLLQSSSDVFEMIDLGYGKCIFAVAAPKGFKYNKQKKLRVASKYPRVAKNFFAQYGRSIEIIKINGSVELAPLVGLSDVIVDIVETGNTLRENGLEVVEPITDISARFIVNRSSLKTKQERIDDLMNRISERI